MPDPNNRHMKFYLNVRMYIPATHEKQKYPLSAFHAPIQFLSKKLYTSRRKEEFTAPVQA